MKKKKYRRVLDKIILNVLCICCLYVVNKLRSLLTNYNLSHTVNFAQRIQNNASTIIANIYVDKIIINLSPMSAILNDVSDHEVFVSAHCPPQTLWKGSGHKM